METTFEYAQSSNHSIKPSRIYNLTRIGVITIMATLFCALLGLSGAQAETYDISSLASFNYTNGASPYAGLLEYKGTFYGTTQYGGKNGFGTIFEITPSGTLTTLYNFDSSDGANPEGTLVQINGKFYGTTSEGGAYNTGTVFEFILPKKDGEDGTLILMHSFLGANGDNPAAGLVQGTDGNLYGTTVLGGANYDGTLFKISPSKPYKLTTLYSFCSQKNCPDGSFPYAPVIQASNGDFYGTTSAGGTGYVGTVFEYTPGKNGSVGTLSTLHSFNSNTEGHWPYAGLVEYNGNFYGATESGGLVGTQDIGQGTIFEITPTGNLTTLYVFSNESDGANPYGTLVEYNGNFYGTTEGGGTYGYGTVFFVDPAGVLVTEVGFDNQMGEGDTILGAYPMAGLVEYNGSFYGTTIGGGANLYGTVFAMAAQ
jgi:uncharacterized repeat protein (TIGR03803 family)